MPWINLVFPAIGERGVDRVAEHLGMEQWDGKIEVLIGELVLWDEDVFTFFEPKLPTDSLGLLRTRASEGMRHPGERQSSLKLLPNKGGMKAAPAKTQRPLPNPEKRSNRHHGNRSGKQSPPEKISWNALDLKGENYFSCVVGRTRTNARYLLLSSDDVVSFLKELADAAM